MSKRNLDSGMRHGCVHAADLSQACTCATLPRAVYLRASHRTISAKRHGSKKGNGVGASWLAGAQRSRQRDTLSAMPLCERSSARLQRLAAAVIHVGSQSAWTLRQEPGWTLGHKAKIQEPCTGNVEGQTPREPQDRDRDQRACMDEVSHRERLSVSPRAGNPELHQLVEIIEDRHALTILQNEFEDGIASSPFPSATSLPATRKIAFRPSAPPSPPNRTIVLGWPPPSANTRSRSSERKSRSPEKRRGYLGSKAPEKWKCVALCPGDVEHRRFQILELGVFVDAAA